MSDLIIAGDGVACEAPVRTWFDHGLEFCADLHPRIRRRFQRPDTLVWHWTGAEGPPERVYQTLRQRGLGVEFAISGDGTIYQYCDPATVDARDCGSWWDRRSIGVEMVCYGMRATATRPWNLLGTPKAGRDRRLVKTHLRGRTVYVADFRDEQYVAADALADALRCVFAIPLAMPMSGDSVMDRPMTVVERAKWNGGEVGHLQITTRSKPDPGVPFLRHRLRAM